MKHSNLLPARRLPLPQHPGNKRLVCLSRVAVMLGCLAVISPAGAADERYHSDSDARYLHHITLYDVDNRKITPDSNRPYSSSITCGRCHEYAEISHGWHFNAFQPDSVDGRPGEPWIWTDDKTGTQLPLSYREWPGIYSPQSIGLSNWDMTLQFGARIAGGNMGSQEANSADPSSAEDSNETGETPPETDSASEVSATRWPLSGSLEVDCMICHAVSGAYDFGERRRQINEQNFAWAPTAALRLGTIQGRVSQIKDGSDPNDEATQQKMPVVTYDPSRFGQDGTVFMDLIRKPSSNACFQCHSNRTVGEEGIDPRWVHDDDVHLRAGMVCADCHRNGIDHHIVRGFDGEVNPSGVSVETLSCSGCHLGTSEADANALSIVSRSGRMGSPKPAHAGLPPIHFEKLTCTACHGGPLPGDQARRIMTSLAHGLGERGHRSGLELPALVAPVFAKGEDGRIAPHRAMWPAFWGQLRDGKVVPLPPNQVYEATRRALRVRGNFIDDILKPKLSSSQLKELVGDDKASKPEEWTSDEKAKVDAAQTSEGLALFNEKVAAALQAIESELNVDQAVYVSSGYVYGRGSEEGTIAKRNADDLMATSMIRWPMAHNVRPAGWALGAGGCQDCHSDTGQIFASTVAAIGPGPDLGSPQTMASLQGVDPDQQLEWNELFQSRASFKYLVEISLALLLMTLCIGLGAFGARISGRAS